MYDIVLVRLEVIPCMVLSDIVEGVCSSMLRVPANVLFAMPLHMSLINTIPSFYHSCARNHEEMEFDEVLMRWYACSII